MRNCALICAAAVLALACTASATSIYVHWNGFDGDYETIQEGINAAGEGDTVLVAGGDYSGPGNRDITFGDHNLVVRSEWGITDVTLDCGDTSRGFELNNTGQDSSTVIRGFRFVNAGDGSNGGTISIYGCSPVIEFCEFISSSAGNGGAIYYGYNTTPGAIRNCIFDGNTCSGFGGGIAIDHADQLDITDCVFFDNESTSSFGGAIGGNGVTGPVTIDRCTIVRNNAVNFSGAMFFDSTAAGTVTVTNTVIALNSNWPTYSSACATSHCVVYGNASGDSLSGSYHDNLFTDPLFCDESTDDFEVCADSPCLQGDPENPWGEQVGFYGSGCPDCDSPVEESTWGSIKTLFR